MNPWHGGLLLLPFIIALDPFPPYFFLIGEAFLPSPFVLILPESLPSPYLWTPLESQGPPLGCRVDQQKVVFSYVPHVPHCKKSRAFKREAQLSLGFSCLGSFPLCPNPLPLLVF